MTQHFVFLLLGLASGAVFASLALALVLIYRSSGVLNFATGAMALLSAYTYSFLRDGKLLVIVPGFPKTVDLGTDRLSFWPALLLTLVVSAAVGLLLYVVVFRPLRTAPAVARAVASIGVMVVLTAVMSQRLGTTPINVEPILPRGIWNVGSVRVSSDRVWFAVTVLAVAMGIGAAFRFTRFGLITRAASETEKGAYLSGIAPDRVAAVNWMISAAVAALSGVLIAPIVPLVPLSYTLFIVPALAAAILARFQYVVVAVVAGLGIGMLQSEATLLKSQHSWLPQSGLPEMVPLALILLILVVRARPLPNRGALIQQTLGRAPRPRRVLTPAVVGAVGGAAGLALLHGTWRSALVTSLIFGIISLSLVVVTGYAGQVSLAQLTLAGVAGFLLGPLTTTWSVPFPVAPLVAALGATVVGVVIGLPAVRVRGLTVAVVTLALAFALEAVWFHNPDFVGANGRDVTGPTFLGLDLRARVGTQFPRLSFCLLVLAVLVAVAVGVAKLRTSQLGSEMLAVRANERSAAGAGIDVVRTKLLAFAIGAFIAGLGGALLGYKQGNVTFDSYTFLVGIALFATVYIAGITSVSGGLLAGVLASGGLVFRATSDWLGLGEWYATIMGVGLIFTVIQNPEGIVGPLHVLLDKRRRRRMPAAVAAAVSPAVHVVETAAARSEADLLSIEAVSVRYGGVVAVDEVTFAVPSGAIVGLIGPNGAGKTTLVDAISGFTTATGAVRLSGRTLDGLEPHERIRAGLGRTFQHIELYDDLSVRENVSVGLAAAAGRSVGRTLDSTLALLDLADVADRPAAELSQGRRQLVSIARALVADPAVLLLDEPAGGLDTTESAWLGDRLRSIRDSGVTILLIDHDMSLVLDVCDQIQVLNFGRVIASGSPAAIMTDRAVADAYLGATHATPATAVES